MVEAQAHSQSHVSNPNGTAKNRYEALSAVREPYLERARKYSKLTLPYVIPPDGHAEGAELPKTWQSVGANGVTNLSAKLLITMLPPNEACFRLRINNLQVEAEEETADKEFVTKIEKSLMRIEQAIVNDIEASADRPVVNEGNIHLVIGGNVLYHNDPKEGLRMFPLSRFVCRRDPMGKVVEIVVHETVDKHTLEPSFLETIVSVQDKPSKTEDDNLDLYTHIQRINNEWKIYQEVNDVVIPESRGDYKDACPWFVVRMYSVAGEHYGRSFVELQHGDLANLESFEQAINEGCIASAKILALVNPNGYTSSTAIANASNGDVIEGVATDVTFLQVQKASDLQLAYQKTMTLESNLKKAFLMVDGMQRQAERVTAEEIKMIAQELENGLGGVYTLISEEFQLPYIRSRMDSLTKRGKIPKLPKDVVAPTIVTGFDAIGRGNDKTKLIEFISTGVQTFGDSFLRMLNVNNAITRLASSLGIKIEGLIKTEEDLAQEQQQAEQQAQQAQAMDMMKQATPEMIKQIAPVITGSTPQG